MDDLMVPVEEYNKLIAANEKLDAALHTLSAFTTGVLQSTPNDHAVQIIKAIVDKALTP